MREPRNLRCKFLVVPIVAGARIQINKPNMRKRSLMSSCVAPRPPMCLSKVVGSILPANDVARNGDLWCTKCEAKVDIHHKDTAKAAVVSGFPQILHQAVDFRITLNSFNMKQNIPTSFTVPRIKLPYPACAFWIRRRFFFQM